MERIRKGMWMAVNEAGGTAGRVKMPNIDIAAKTGTAQSVDRGKKSNNAWTVSFAPFENPKYAIAVLVVGGKSGGKVAGPLTQMIYRSLFALDDGLTFKPRPQTEFVGKIDSLEEITFADDALAAFETADATETADNAQTNIDAITKTNDPENNTTQMLPTPTITPEIDSAGTIPRAKPVDE